MQEFISVKLLGFNVAGDLATVCIIDRRNRTYELSARGGLIVTQIIWFSRVDRLTCINQFSNNLLARRHYLESHERSSERNT